MNAAGGKKNGKAFQPQEFFDLSVFLGNDTPPEVRRAPPQQITSGWDTWAQVSRQIEARKTAGRRLG